MTRPDAGLESLIDQARRDDEPDRDASARVRRALAARLGPAAFATASIASNASATATTGSLFGSGLALKVVLPVLLAAAAGGTVLAVRAGGGGRAAGRTVVAAPTRAGVSRPHDAPGTTMPTATDGSDTPRTVLASRANLAVATPGASSPIPPTDPGRAVPSGAVPAGGAAIERHTPLGATAGASGDAHAAVAADHAGPTNLSPSAGTRRAAPALAPNGPRDDRAPGTTHAPSAPPGLIAHTAVEAGSARSSAQGGAPSSAQGGAPAGVSGGLSQEVSLVRDANTALRGGEWARATALLDAHDARFPRGALRTEARGLRVIAACGVAHDAQSVRAAEQFVREEPGSSLVAWVLSACGVASRTP